MRIFHSIIEVNRDRGKEYLIYLALWLFVFMVPVVSLFLRASTDVDMEYDWDEVFRIWGVFIIYLIVFFVHNILIAPLLIYKRRVWLYLTLAMVLLVSFQLYRCGSLPLMDVSPSNGKGIVSLCANKVKEVAVKSQEINAVSHQLQEYAGAAFPNAQVSRPELSDESRLFMLSMYDVIGIIMVVLMFGMNLAVKYFFKSQKDAKELEKLEKRNLQMQLTYLQYQINPHFFMNTLNNIHALVDIDPEKSKSTILELSGLMRYMLYEGAKKTVSLQHEIDFIRNYIKLMSIRYSGKVKINVDVQKSLPDKSVPPLLFISFVENAFKHGISYKKMSYVNIEIFVEDDFLKFRCINSKPDGESDKSGGVGLSNIRERLRIIYGDSFHLLITDAAEEYSVSLDVPIDGIKNDGREDNI